jgi:hypothetical protein
MSARSFPRWMPQYDAATRFRVTGCIEVLTVLLEETAFGTGRGHRGGLAVVRTMIEKGGT